MDDESFNIRVPKRWARLALVVTVTALIVAPLTAIASHTFTDVPDTNTFHSDIDWLADAGITKGCNPPANTEFCPDDDVSRGQMAAFMKRFAGYIGAEDGTPTQADNATNADNAASADNATNADNAASADNANKLGGADPDEYQPGELPAGKTVTGAFYILGTATAANQYETSTNAYIYSMPSLPATHYIDVGDPLPDGCPGNDPIPQADPGHLCVYEEGTSNVTSFRGIDQARRTGFGIWNQSAAAGSFFTYGTWAATAADSGGAGAGQSDNSDTPTNQ